MTKPELEFRALQISFLVVSWTFLTRKKHLSEAASWLQTGKINVKSNG
jgi:hypothetical protein